MENKILLLKLIDEYRNSIINNPDYVLSMSVLDKLNSFCFKNEDGNDNLDFSVIGSLTEEELNVFTVDSVRVIAALTVLSSKVGWRVETVKQLVKRLEQDITTNKTDKFLKDKSSFDKLYKIIENELYFDNYMLIFEFINASVESSMISLKDAIALNYYLLKECSVNGKTYNDLDIEIATVQNVDDYNEMVDILRNIFIDNGYEYNQNKLTDLEDKFLKYINFDYVDYVLSMFKKYNIDNKDLYLRLRTFYLIVIDNDKETFDSILKFIDDNNCNLKTLLAIPSIFSKKKRRYRERNKATKSSEYYERDLFEIYGFQQDFFENIELYKKLTGIEIIEDSQLIGLSKFLCTPSVVINKNLQLLRLYKIVGNDEFPKSVVSLCGNSVEYLIDRYIETGLYEQYLASRYDNGKQKAPRGTSYLDRDSNPFRFYKLKLANSLGYNVFATNKGIQKIFYDDSMDYMGLSLQTDDKGGQYIKQEPFVTKCELSDMSDFDLTNDIFNFFYKYKVVSPISIFSTTDNLSSKLRGERINGVFLNDYKYILSNEDIKNIETDSVIAIFDNSMCLLENGDYRKVKVNDLRYEFTHPNFPQVKVIISRYKVLRLCKLLKEDGAWISDNINDDMINTILCVLLKDTIVSEAEITVLKFNIREIFKEILINNLIPEKIRKRV